ncbi:MAG: phosphatidylglycerophosphatase A [Candidatus Eisenbacteria bacterium]
MPESSPGRLNPVTAFIATGAYSGYSPLAPGTAGSLVCAALAWFLLPQVTFGAGWLAVGAMAVSLAAFVAGSVWAADRAESVYGKDASRIVVDEFAGYLVAVAFLPKSAFVYVAAFLLFRALDVLKPFPARRLESVRGGAGIVLDDLVAGLYANVFIRIMLLVQGF